MPISKDFTSIYFQTFEIDFFECNPYGKLKLVDLCKLIQKVASTHSVLGGISFLDLQQVDQAWVLNKFRIELKEAMPRWQDQITITTWIEKMDGIRSIRNFEIRNNNKLIAVATSLWVILNTKRRRPEVTKLPHNHFIKYSDQKVTEAPFSKAPRVKYRELSNSVVKYSDLDMVNHVTNTKYLEWCIDIAFENNIELQNIHILDMHFMKEMHLNDIYNINCIKENNKIHFTIDTATATTFYCCLENK
ncbi:acyl-[acyl-carrier-protein] thioesterase [Myroides indicus]|uniref:Acyl-ACP thioesterase n=1 Tax=Myroides indicus TaxID=1323422 RepID=A0A4R7FAA2_9FLAO|nr:acyl-ACP thioesterase domain-containing protein [Myroides indicus]TDS66138.1 acyl-ACP thioesterase [Myroides indicus]